MPDRIMRWARWTRGDPIEAQVPCEVTSDGRIIPPAGWELMEHSTPAERKPRQSKRGSKSSRPQQPDIPGLLP